MYVIVIAFERMKDTLFLQNGIKYINNPVERTTIANDEVTGNSYH